MMLDISNMNSPELRSYYKGYVRRLEQIVPTDDEEKQFIALQQRILSELDRKFSIYKVSSIDTTREHYGGLMEHNAMYFTSLRAAKRELKKRVRALLKSPLVAGPEEVMDLGINSGIAPSLVQSIITNHDLKKKPPGRFKLYEVRMLVDGCVIPVQVALCKVHTSDHQLPALSLAETSCAVIPFPKIII